MNLSHSPALPRLPERAANSHKGDFGQALLVGGSRGMSGAIALAGMATLRSGAGLVKLAVPDVCLESVAAHEPSYMTAPLPSDDKGRIAGRAKQIISELAGVATCIACGPGLGRSVELTELVCWMYQTIPQPLVIDADALNALSDRIECLSLAGGPRVLTPHPGEFRRLIDQADLADHNLTARAVDLAKSAGIVLVLKGHHTLITDGKLQFRNMTGNPGMATGGTGDVLTGVITALICQGLQPLEAARLGAHVHGLAGDLAAEESGQISMMATDVVDFLPASFLELPAEFLELDE